MGQRNKQIPNYSRIFFLWGLWNGQTDAQAALKSRAPSSSLHMLHYSCLSLHHCTQLSTEKINTECAVPARLGLTWHGCCRFRRGNPSWKKCSCQPGLQVSLWSIFLIYDWCGRTPFTVVHPWAGGPGCEKKAAWASLRANQLVLLSLSCCGLSASLPAQVPACSGL